jgi:hypothetical protein
MANSEGIDREDMSELNAIFKEMGGVDKIEDYTNNFEELADGNYKGEVIEVITKNSKNTGRPMIDITLGLEGERKEHVFLMLAGKDLKATQTAIARTVKQLKELGIDGSTVEDYVDGALGIKAGTRINLEISTNGTFKAKWITLA